MIIVVTGVKGQLGYDVIRELKQKGRFHTSGIDINDVDITKHNEVETFFAKCKPDAIIHCAAFTAVDRAEDERDACMNVNVIGTRNLVEQATKYGSKIIFISTDYVFDGSKVGAYEIDDKPNPISVYGESKYLGELEVMKHIESFIVRVSWVFGRNGNNFVDTMLRLGREKDNLKIVSDQVGSPTYTVDLAKFLVELVETEKYGIYHVTNEGTCSWYEFAKEIFALTNTKIPIFPINTYQYPTKAKRPLNSVLSKSSLDSNGFKRLPNWKDALRRYLEEVEVL